MFKIGQTSTHDAGKTGVMEVRDSEPSIKPKRIQHRSQGKCLSSLLLDEKLKVGYDTQDAQEYLVIVQADVILSL